MQLVLSVSGISFDVRKNIEDIFDSDKLYYTLSCLRKMPVFSMLKFLWSYKEENLFIVYNKQCEESVLPILYTICFFTRSKFINLVDEKYSLKKSRKIFLYISILKLIFNTLFVPFLSLYFYADLLVLKLANRSKIKSFAMKVLYLKTNLWFGVKAGGSIGHIAGVVNALAKKGFEVFYCSAEGPILIDNKVKKIKIPYLDTYVIPAEFNLYKFHFKSYQYLLKKLRPEGIIYQRLSLGNYLGVKLSRHFKLPLIIEYNGSEVWISKNWGGKLKLERLACWAEEVSLKHAHLVVTISHELEKDLINRGVEKNRIVMYPNCVDVKMYDPNKFSNDEIKNLRSKMGFSDGDLVFTFIGTFGNWHGVEFLAEAIKELDEKHRDFLVENKVKFCLIGDGKLLPQVKNILSSPTLKKIVYFSGIVEQEDGVKYLAASDVFLSPHLKNKDGSNFFGSPTKLFEYMAMGKCIIASDIDQISEILVGSQQIAQLLKTSSQEKILKLLQNKTECKEAAILIRPSCIDDLVMAIKFVPNNLYFCKRLGENARDRVLENYTWDRHVDKILLGINKVIK